MSIVIHKYVNGIHAHLHFVAPRSAPFINHALIMAGRHDRDHANVSVSIEREISASVLEHHTCARRQK